MMENLDRREPVNVGIAIPATLDSEAALSAAIHALSQLDPGTVARMVDAGCRPALRLRPAGFEGIARIVVAQQVSTASAAAIFSRLAGALTPFSPAILVTLPDDTLRACGLSRPKIKTLRALAEAVETGTLPLDRLAGMPADEALACLVAVKGIGPWTAQVFLLFCLGHGNAWPAGDLALQEAARSLLGLDQRPDAAEMRRIGERWRPHRGAAAYLLWSYYRVRKNRAGLVLTQDPA